jgi:hypothetical protein
MKKVTIELDEAYGNVLTITAIGVLDCDTNIVTASIDLLKNDYIKIDENGKAYKSMEGDVPDD